MRLLAALVVLAELGCRCPAPVRPPVQPPVEVVTVRVDCLASRPPQRPAISGTMPKCDGWEACLDEANLRAVAAHLAHRAALESWSDEAWHRCGPNTKGGP